MVWRITHESFDGVLLDDCRVYFVLFHVRVKDQEHVAQSFGVDRTK